MSSGSVTPLNAARNCRRAPLAFPAMSTGVALGIPAEWAEWINAYLQTLAAIGRPATTIGLRRSHLARLARTINTTPGAVTEGQLTAWFAGQTGWRSAETRRSYRNTIRKSRGDCRLQATGESGQHSRALGPSCMHTRSCEACSYYRTWRRLGHRVSHRVVSQVPSSGSGR